ISSSRGGGPVSPRGGRRGGKTRNSHFGKSEERGHSQADFLVNISLLSGRNLRCGRAREAGSKAGVGVRWDTKKRAASGAGTESLEGGHAVRVRPYELAESLGHGAMKWRAASQVRMVARYSGAISPTAPLVVRFMPWSTL